MENIDDASTKTEIKYKITSCYFCSEFLDNDNFKSHIDQCGQVLQKCPNKCVAYIPRKYIEQHLQECPHKFASDAKQESDYRTEDFVLEQSIVTLRSALHEEIRQRHRLISDIGELRRGNQRIDTWIQRFDDSLNALKKSLHNEAESRCIDVENCQKSVEQLTYQYKEVKEWRKELRVLLDRFTRDLEFRNDVTANLDVLFGDNETTAARIKSLEAQVEELKANSIQKHVEDMKNDSFPESEQFASTASAPSTMKRAEALPQKYCTVHCALLETKLAKLTLEVHQMKNIVCESEDKCDKMEKFVTDTRKICAQTRQELIDLEVQFRMQKKMKLIVSSDGRLIWRIDHYTAKLKEAKTNDVMIRSPIFSNENYGYNLRLDILLDGFGTWKGRNLLACLTVVSGEWDSLLQWPCNLKADIILRDQPNDSSTAKNIAKTIFVKKRNATYETNQYIFISHKTILTQSYLKNDTLFFEVRVDKT